MSGALFPPLLRTLESCLQVSHDRPKYYISSLSGHGLGICGDFPFLQWSFETSSNLFLCLPDNLYPKQCAKLSVRFRPLALSMQTIWPAQCSQQKVLIQEMLAQKRTVVCVHSSFWWICRILQKHYGGIFSIALRCPTIDSSGLSSI